MTWPVVAVLGHDLAVVDLVIASSTAEVVYTDSRSRTERS